LKSAIDDFEPIVAEAESEKTEAVEIDKDKLITLLTALETLLEKSDFGAAGYVDELRGIAGMEALATIMILTAPSNC
jgi:hypothetical protein